MYVNYLCILFQFSINSQPFFLKIAYFKKDEPQRVCIGCVEKHGALDMTRTGIVY